MPSLDSGGGEKSLVNLLSTLDYQHYEVELRLFARRGLFLDLVPKEVKITEISGDYLFFSKGFLPSILYFLLRLKLALVFHRFAFLIKNSWIKNKAVAEQQTWKNKATAIPQDQNHYDAAVAFIEKSSIYYLVDKIKAKQKIGWIHTNYSSSGLYADFDRNFFSQLDYLVTVSPECRQSLWDCFPEIHSKIKVIHNIVSPKTVQELALQKIEDSVFQTGKKTIVTVARLSREKGIDIAAEACKIVVQQHPDLKWYVIGDGNERNSLHDFIRQNQLESNLVLLGLRANPYPYVKQATLYVQPSRYEGKSIAIDEAKILAKPIIVTDFTTAKDQIQHQVNGIISGNNAQQLASDILLVLNDTNLQNKLSLHLTQEWNDTSAVEINQFYSLLNG